MSRRGYLICPAVRPQLAMDISPDAMPYWHVNVPEAEREEQCPDFLRVLSEKDERIISTPDDKYRMYTWPEVQDIILQNRIDLFQRQPSNLRRYLASNWKIKQGHGSVMNFVLTQRVKWAEPVVARGRPFEFDDDIKILYNDWPYGIDERIVHLVIWTKFDLAENPETGDLSDEARSQIQTYVDRIFLPSIPSERVSGQNLPSLSTLVC